MAIDKSDYQRVFATVFTHAEELLRSAQRHPNALAQYLESWLEIAEKAAEVDNLALQDVILLFIDATGPAFKKTPNVDSLTDAQWQLLKKWDNLFADYIKTPDDQQLALALIQCLNDPLLAMGLEHEDELMLLDSFLPVIKQLSIYNKHDPINTIPTSTEPAIWEKLAIVFAEVEQNFQEILAESTLNSSEEIYSKKLKHYLASWKVITEAIEAGNDAELAKILDVVSLFIEFSCQLFNQTARLNAQQQNLLSQWHTLFDSYIKVQSSQQLVAALIRLLAHPLWLQPISKTDEQMLLAEFEITELLNSQRSSVTQDLQQQNSAADTAIANPAVMTEPAISTPVETPTIESELIWKSLEQHFIEAVLNLKAMVTEQKLQNKPAFAKSMQEYQKSWQQIVEIIEAKELHSGLLDLVLLFIEITSSAFEQNGLDSQHLLRLKKWHGLFGNYVKTGGDRQFILPLIECLSDTFWPAAIAAEDEQILLRGFNISVSAAAESEKNLPVAALAEEMLVSENSVVSISAALTEQQPESSTKPTPKKYTLWQQLEELFNKTELLLKVATEEQQQHEEQALKTSLQHYLESWLAIAQQIEIEGTQLGLLDVVLLFIEVSRQTFYHLDSFDEKQLTLLKHWQNLFSRYLETKGNRQLAVSLIKCLRDPLWQGAIMAEDEEMLLAGFSDMPATTPESASKALMVIEPIEPVITDVISTAHNTESAIALADSESNRGKENLIWQDIQPEFNQALAILKATVDSEIINDTAAFKHGLQDYVERWQIIADFLASSETLVALSDVVLLFTEISRQTFIRLESLSSEQFALLNHWQALFAGFFNSENNSQFTAGLIRCLRNAAWFEPIAAEDELMLLDVFGIDEHSQADAQTVTEPELIVDIEIEADKNPVWQKIAVFFDEVQAQLSLILESSGLDNTQTCRNYVRQYAEHWQVIAEIIAEEHQPLQTLTDLTLLFADNCLELVEQNVDFTQEYIQLLQTWHTAFTNFFQNITATQVNSLLECLENSYWLRPLTAVDKQMLLELLAEENQQQSIIADDSKNLLLFNEGLFSEQENIEAQPEASLNSDQAVLFTEEISPAERDDDFALFAEDLDDQEFDASITTEETIATDSEAVVLFADEILGTEAEDDFALFSEDAENAEIAEQSITAPSSENVIVSANTEDDLIEESAVPTATVNPELIGMVRDEFELLVSQFNAEINAASDIKAFKVALKNHEFKFENLAKACNTIGLLGLEQVFRQLSLNMRSRRDSDNFTERESELFKATLPLIQNYLAAVTQRNHSDALVTHLTAQGWKQPLTTAQADPLIELLSEIALSSYNQELENRKTVAELADVSLELPEDVNSELLDSLLNELPILTHNFSAVIQQIIAGDNNVQKLLEAQRIAHTLKGSGNIVGVTGIAVLTHHLEEILEYLSKHETFPTTALAGVLLESADCLEMMSDLMLNSEKQPPDQALSVLQNVLNWANQIASADLPSEDSEVETTTLPAQPNTNLTPVVKETKALESVPMTRVPSETIDKLLRLTGEGGILNEQFKERIQRFSNELKLLNDLTWQMHSLVSELDQSINIQSYNTKSNRVGTDNQFDALEMEQYNELHTAASRIAEVATDIREINTQMDQQLVDLKYLMVEEDAIQKENQEMVQSIRMVPANTIASRCQRIVRQACRATNKEVDLEIKGADLLIDSEILNDMVEPLMHLLRNSIDHGIEPLHIREKFNKPKVGKITLEFSRKGNYAVISCKDDGGGLASGNILQTAIKKGLISAKQQLTEAEIHKLILIPGFSTRAVATQTSGRGIGMDAIQTKISAIQGQMSLFSARGEGLTIEITIPLTLSSMLSLLVKCGGQTMAISNRGLRKIHHSDECTLVEEEQQLYCSIDNERYPAKHFAELVGIPITYSAEKKLQGLRIEDEIGRTHIVFVEELLGYRDLLVKNIGSYIPHIQGITGASILGNGDVAPVIDLVEMLHHAAKYDYVLADATKALADSINGLPVALVVDDSLSARRAVAMLLKDSGLDVETAIDGLDAIKQIDKTMPDIILVDLEMPRMNGIELTAHVRGREGMKNTPIIMITSRATEKHRKQAEAAGVTKFMTKPFTEDDLINNVRMLMK